MDIDLTDFLEGLMPMEQVGNLKLPDPVLIQYYMAWKNREIWLDEGIDWGNVAEMYKFIMHLNQTDKSDDPKPITIYIMSNGGHLDIMFALYDLIKKSRIPIHTVNLGRAHSAAFIIFLAGQVRQMTPYATFIAHEGSTVMSGSYRETKAAMVQYDKDVEKMCRIIADETNLEYEFVKKRFGEDQDWYIGFEEANEAGIIRPKALPQF